MEDGFEAILNKYESQIYNFAFQLTNDSINAEAILTEVFSSIYDEIEDIAYKKSTRFDLVTMLYQLVLKFSLRSTEEEIEKVKNIVEQLQYVQFNSPKKNIKVEDSTQEYLLDLVSRLPQEYKHVFLLRDVQELPEAQTSEILGLPRITVRSILSRARLMVKRLMKEYPMANLNSEILGLASAKNSQIRTSHLL